MRGATWNVHGLQAKYREVQEWIESTVARIQATPSKGEGLTQRSA